MSRNGFGGGFGNIVKQASQMQQRIQKIQAELGEKTAEGTAGGGMVTVVASGKQELVSIKINPEVLKTPDAEMLEEMVLEATNQALRKISKMVSEAMGQVTGGLSIPGLF